MLFLKGRSQIWPGGLLNLQPLEPKESRFRVVEEKSGRQEHPAEKGRGVIVTSIPSCASCGISCQCKDVSPEVYR